MVSLIGAMTTALAAVEEPAPLIMPAWAFVAIAATVFILLGVVTWSFRDVANRHSNRVTGRGDSHSAGHGTGH